jgi:hypothetical protein
VPFLAKKRKILRRGSGRLFPQTSLPHAKIFDKTRKCLHDGPVIAIQPTNLSAKLAPLSATGDQLLRAAEIPASEILPLGKARSLRVRTVPSPLRKNIGSPTCPFDEKNTSSPEFLEKLRAAFRSGEPLPPAKSHSRVLIIYPAGWVSEGEETQRMKECYAERGCECCIGHRSDETVTKIVNPNYVLSLDPSIPPLKGFHCATKWHRDGCSAQNALRYENIFHATPDAEKLILLASDKGKKIRTMRLYPTTTKSEFYDGAKRRLCLCGANWDWRRGNHYANLYRSLDGTDYFDAYGPAWAWRGKIFHSYRGYLPSETSALRDVMQKDGVALVLHSDDHLMCKAPTQRIFAAAAASCVIISDRHPFVVENFGDSVLYVDQNASTEEMFRQIDGHMRWILAHPKEAVALARRSHAVFIEKFPLEKEVERIEQFFQENARTRSTNG